MTIELLLAILGALVGSGLLWLASGRLEDASHRLAEHHSVPDAVKGATLTAASSSFPELATAVLATAAHSDFDLALSSVVGSAIFNVLAIPAASVFAIGGHLKVKRTVVYRETQFYLLAVMVLLLALSFSVIYNGQGGRTDAMEGHFTWQLALFPLALYGLYLYFQYEEVRDHRSKGERKSRPAARLDAPFKEWAALCGSALVILVGVEILLRAVVTLGDILNTPTFLWGLTVVAAATSLPDMFVSIRSAKNGRSDSAVSNALGSNVFDLLVAVPLAVVVVGSVAINFRNIVPMMAFLVAATIVVLVVLRRDTRLTLGEARFMLALYGAFAAWMVLEALGITRLLG